MIIAAVLEATIMTTKDFASSGDIPNLESFLEKALKLVQKRQKRTTDWEGHAHDNPALDWPEAIHSVFKGFFFGL